jgi:tetratricopeptide (TPR) repeat protein
MEARFWLAWATGSEGDVDSAVDQYQQVLGRATALSMSPTSKVLPLYATTLCWAAQFGHAIERARDAVQVARAAHDTDSTILGLQVQGLALAGTGRYDEALRVFDEAARFGREFGIGPFLARSIAMSAGFHLDVFDFDGHAALAEEARDMAQAVDFPPPLVSAKHRSAAEPRPARRGGARRTIGGRGCRRSPESCFLARLAVAIAL